MPEPQGWTLVQKAGAPPPRPATPTKPAPAAPTSAPGWTLVKPAATAPPAGATQGMLPPSTAAGDPTPPRSRGQAAVDDLKTRTDNAKQLFNTWVQEGPHRVVEGIRDLMSGEYARGTHKVITGGGLTALPMVAPGAARAIIAAPAAAALTVGGSVAAQQAAPPIARALGATPDQADVVGDVAGIGAGTAIAKVSVPALARWSTTRQAKSLGKAYEQATRDTMAALGVNAEEAHLARPFLEAVHANPANPVTIAGTDAAGPRNATAQLVNAADLAVKEIEQHVSSVIAQFPQAIAPAPARAVLTRVMQMPGTKPSDVAAARAVIAEYGLDQPRSLADAESLRVRLNAENGSVLEGTGVRQRTAVLTSPAYVARQQAANSLRDGIYDTLEANGVEGIRNLRRSEGAVLKLRNAAVPLTRGLRSEATVARTGKTNLPRRLGQMALRAGGAASGAMVAGPVGAAVGSGLGEGAGAGLVTKNLSRNALLERAFQQQFTAPPVMSTQSIPSGAAIPPQGSPRLPTAARLALPPARRP